MTSIKGWWIKQISCCFQLKATMKLTLILLLFVWDNVEAVPCPSLTVDRNVLVIGDIDQPTSGSVLQFSCSSRNDKLVGPTQIICDENGNWDKSPPTCREILCLKPPLENFVVEQEQTEYVKGEFLTYSCNPGYRKMDGRPPKCSKVGLSSQWTPMPRCEPITCYLSAHPPEETTYNPQNQILFRPNETATVSCGEKHWVKSTELQSAELTCLDTGDWDFEALCRPVTCSKGDVEHIEHVYWAWTEFNTVDMDETLSYQCHTDYVKTSDRATCTRRGWEPKLLCKETFCPKPPLENFEVEGEKPTYKQDEFLTYSCNPGYRKVDESPSQCKTEGNSTEWIPAPKCELITCKLDSNPSKEATDNPQDKTIFRPGETVTVSCGENRWVTSTCQDTGDWDFEPVCKPITCHKLDDQHVYVWQHPSRIIVNLGETLWYQCYSRYRATSPTATATCTRRGWEPNPLCRYHSSQ